MAYGRSSIVACLRGLFAMPITIRIFLRMFEASLLRLNIEVGRWVLSPGLSVPLGALKQKLNAINLGNSI